MEDYLLWPDEVRGGYGGGHGGKERGREGERQERREAGKEGALQMSVIDRLIKRPHD